MHKDMILRESMVKSTKILAGKNVKVLMEGFAPHVKFNPKTKQPEEIVIPMIPDDCPKELINAIKGYQDHEAYHILYSSFDDICDSSKDRVWHYLHNVVDDNHINARGAKDFPGTHIELMAAYRYLYNNLPQYETAHIEKVIASNKKNAMAGYIVSWVARKMNSDFQRDWYDASPLPDLYKELEDKMSDKLRDDLAKCSTPKEVRQLTDDLKEFLKEFEEELDEIAASSDKSKDGKPSKTSGKGGKGKGEGDEKEGEGYDEDAPPIDTDDFPGSLEDGLKGVIGKNIAIKFKEKKGTFFWSERMNEIVTIDQYRGKGLDISMSDGLEEFDSSCKAVSNYLRKRLERLLEARSRVYYTGGFKSGKLTGKNLFSVPMGNTSVFSKKSEIRALNTAVGLLSDLSGSMGGAKVKLASQSAYTMADCLERLKIPFEVLGFWTDAGVTMSPRSVQEAYEEFARTIPDKSLLKKVVNATSVNTTFIFKTYEESFGLKQKTALMAASQGKIGLHQNEDASHVKIALERLSKQPQEKKVLFVFSDGSPCFHGSTENSRSKLKELAANSMRDYGVTIVGIGILCNNVTEFYDNTKVINKLEELPQTVFEVLTAQLLNRK